MRSLQSWISLPRCLEKTAGMPDTGRNPTAKELREAGRVCALSPAQQNGHLCGKAGLHWLIPPNGMLRFKISLRESSEPSRSED
jgi:hypothetical protein